MLEHHTLIEYLGIPVVTAYELQGHTYFNHTYITVSTYSHMLKIEQAYFSCNQFQKHT